MNCHETVTVNAKAVNWLKEKYPELCIKAGLCERVAGRLYTKTFTTPQPQREWVGLTDEEMRELEKQFYAERVRTTDEEYLVIYPADYWQWQRAIEAKLKEKNFGMVK